MITRAKSRKRLCIAHSRRRGGAGKDPPTHTHTTHTTNTRLRGAEAHSKHTLAAAFCEDHHHVWLLYCIHSQRNKFQTKYDSNDKSQPSMVWLLSAQNVSTISSWMNKVPSFLILSYFILSLSKVLQQDWHSIKQQTAAALSVVKANKNSGNPQQTTISSHHLFCFMSS